jgi:phosphoribosylformimino-5-aminoimidazole carboxamide ribotide isomerase
VIGVIDLLAGRAVHARAGHRDRYQEVQTVAGSPIEPGDAAALARAYTDRFGIAELYVADLDAIMGGAPQDDLVRALAACGSVLWLDAAISSVDRARDALAIGAGHVIVGLETLGAYEVLRAICGEAGGDRVAFSLDLRDSVPLVMDRSTIPRETPHEIAARAAGEGAGSVIVIDLARVGTGAGPDLELISRVRRAVPGVTLLAGGGVRGVTDLAHLADAGCDAALVATALHEGRIGGFRSG